MLIDHLEITMDGGLNIITGETGSGKSIILEAIQGLFSARLNTDLIRNGEAKSYLEGVFSSNKEIENWLANLEIESSDQEGFLTVSRELSEKGSRARINGVLVPAKQVQELGEILLEIQGQNTEQKLLQSKNQLGLLDGYLGDKHELLLSDYRLKYQDWRKTQQKLAEGKDKIIERGKELDYLKFQFKEIEVLNLEDPLEEDKLKKQIDKLSKSETTSRLIEDIQQKFYEDENSVSGFLALCKKNLSECAKADDELLEHFEQLSSLQEQLEDLMRDLRSYGNATEDEVDIDSLNQRANNLQKLRRKHGFSSLGELINYQKQLASRIEELENLSENLDALEKQSLKQEMELRKLAISLSTARKKAAVNLSKKISDELASLSLKGAKFEIQCNPVDSLGTDGCDKVDFLFQANAGDNLKPLAKVASGGELSRITLILKTILGSDSTIIFDEIDSGTSGKVSRLIGEKLARLALKQQVICVTHQPLLAAFADKHFLVQKLQNQNTTKLEVSELKGDEEKTDALLELMIGERDKILAKDYAKELISESKNKKHDFKIEAAQLVS